MWVCNMYLRINVFMEIKNEFSETILCSGDYTLPKGSQVILSSFLNHRIEETFPNPEEFNPDRFAPEKVEKLHTCAYFPFSAGPKSCIGNRKCLFNKMSNF